MKAPPEMPALAEPVSPLLAEGVLALVSGSAHGTTHGTNGTNGTDSGGAEAGVAEITGSLAIPTGLPALPAQPRPREAARRLFLERSAVTLGQTWAEEWRADLRREGRPAAGGWPGTLREARVRVERFLLAEMSRRKMAAVTEAEREVAARAAYASARHEWCRQAEPEAP